MVEKNLKTKVKELEGRLNQLEKKTKNQFKLLRRDLDRLLDGTDEKPGIIKQLKILTDIMENKSKK